VRFKITFVGPGLQARPLRDDLKVAPYAQKIVVYA